MPLQPVFDRHDDALTRETTTGWSTAGSAGTDLARMREGGMRGGIFAVFTPSAEGTRDPVAQPDAAAFASAAAGRLLGTCAKDTCASPAGSPTSTPPATATGLPVAVLHLEGAEAIDPGLEALELWYGAGLRSWTGVEPAQRFRSWRPVRVAVLARHRAWLTDAGRALAARCSELGILVDVSHLNEAGFWDLARMEAGPIVATHSAAHALAQASRNLTDAQLDAIGASGGLVGIVFGSRSCGPTSPTTPTPRWS